MGKPSPSETPAPGPEAGDLARVVAQAGDAARRAAGSPPADPRLGPLWEADRTLAMEHNLLMAVIDLVPERVFVRDRAGRHVMNNRAQLRAIGAATLEDTLGRTEFDFYPEALAREIASANERAMSAGEPSADVEQMIPGPGGAQTWWSTTRVPLRDAGGAVVGVVGISRNVTERRQATRKISEQAAMLDQAHDAIFLLTLDGRISYINESAGRVLGWEPSAVLGMPGTALFPAEDRAALSHAMSETLGKGSWHGELRLHHKLGHEILLEVRRTLIRDESGVPVAQLSICADVTDKRRRDALAIRNQRLESLGTLAGGIAHDLNNVLAPIMMSIALLRHKVPDESGQRLIGMLERNAERGAQLVRQVLAFGRGTEGQRIVIQPRLIGREIAQIVADTFPKAVEFEIDYEQEPWTVMGDPVQLHQVVLNLCVNARDAMPKGGKITLGFENTVLGENGSGMSPGSKAGPHLLISVADTGTGMAADVSDRIFEPFFTTKDHGKGPGLGLSTSLGIIRSHGGFINVVSDVGKGSTFRIYLPAGTEPTGQAAPEPAAPSAGAARAGRNELVLVVDDEEPILEVARATLERSGYRVLVASNGAEAVSIYALQRDAIAVVLTDMSMPVMDGPAMVVALKAINPAVRIIGSSGLEGFKPADPGRSGVLEFIPKPYSADTMLAAVSRAVGAGATPKTA